MDPTKNIKKKGQLVFYSDKNPKYQFGWTERNNALLT